jgi:hypothetical protein
MRSPTKETNERRTTERRGVSDRRSAARVASDRRVVDQRGIAHAMVDALEDILKWERASERSLRVMDPSNPDLSN